jgi:hypothetical protein
VLGRKMGVLGSVSLTHRNRLLWFAQSWMGPFRNLWPIRPIDFWCMDDRNFIPSKTAGSSAEHDQQ